MLQLLFVKSKTFIKISHLNEPVNQDGAHVIVDVGLLGHVVVLGHMLVLK